MHRREWFDDERLFLFLSKSISLVNEEQEGIKLRAFASLF